MITINLLMRQILETRIHNANRFAFVGFCFRFARKNLQVSPCLERLTSEFCPHAIEEVEQWPPIMQSTSLTSQREGNGQYSYDVSFEFSFVITNCSDRNFFSQTKQTCDFSATVALGSAFLLTLIAVVITVPLLIIKTRLLTKYEKKEENIYVLPEELDNFRSLPNIPNTNVGKNRKQDDTYTMPCYVPIDGVANEQLRSSDGYTAIEKHVTKNEDSSVVPNQTDNINQQANFRNNYISSDRKQDDTYTTTEYIQLGNSIRLTSGDDYNMMPENSNPNVVHSST